MEQSAHAQTIVVETPMGPVIGARVGRTLHLRRLRYAAPPVGARRFAMPQEARPWTAPVDCSCEGAIPPQLPSRLAKVMGDYPAAQDEDCLHLDLWASSDAGPNAPVLVFLHGGAFMTGGGSLACYDGRILAERTGMVVVNVSYRLGVLGFLPILGIAPANLGLHEQIAALHFIREIAKAFGGDPDNITVAGQSAGAYAIALFLANAATRPLFRRAIMMSAPLGLQPKPADQALAEAFLADLAIQPGDREAVCALPAERLIEAQGNLLRHAAPAPGEVTPPFMPVIDGDLASADLNAALCNGATAEIDLMIGTTREEMAAFYFGDSKLAAIAPDVLRASFERRYGEGAPNALRKAAAHRAPSTPVELLGDIETDKLFTEPSLKVAAGHAAHGGRAFVYRFDWQSSVPGIGACHCVDLPFLFGNFAQWRNAPMLAAAGEREIEDLSRIFQHAVAAFARNGAPRGPDLPDWPDHSHSGATLHFDRKIMVSASAA